MALEPVTFANMAKLGMAQVPEMIEADLAAAVKDITDDRPGETGKRQVIVTFTLEPKKGQTSPAGAEQIEFSAKSVLKIPAQESDEFTCKAGADGQLTRRPGASADAEPDQMTLTEEENRNDD